MPTPLKKARFVLAALAAVSLALAPTLASAQSRRSPGSRVGGSLSDVGSMYYTAGVGLAVPFESGMSAGFKVDGGGFYVLQALNATTFLDLGGNLAFTYHGGDFSTWMLDLLPTARLRFAVAPQWSLYADGGLGLGIVGVSYDIPYYGSYSDSTVAFLFKFGGGAAFRASPQLTLLFEPAFNFYVKDGSFTSFSMLFGARFGM